MKLSVQFTIRGTIWFEYNPRDIIGHNALTTFPLFTEDMNLCGLAFPTKFSVKGAAQDSEGNDNANIFWIVTAIIEYVIKYVNLLYIVRFITMASGIVNLEKLSLTSFTFMTETVTNVLGAVVVTFGSRFQWGISNNIISVIDRKN